MQTNVIGRWVSDICMVATLVLAVLASSSAAAGDKQWEPIRRVKAPSAVHSLAASPVGNLVAVGCEKGEILLFDPHKGELRPFVQIPDGGDISLLAFTPDGKYVVSYAPDWLIGFWEISNGKKRKRSRCHRNRLAEKVTRRWHFRQMVRCSRHRARRTVNFIFGILESR